MSEVCEQLIQRQPAGDGVVAARPRVVHHRHPETHRPTRHRLPDLAVADDAQPRAVDVLGEQQRVVALRPAAGAHQPVALDQSPSRREDEPEGQVGDGLVQHTGGIGDGHALLTRRRDVHRVVADADERQQPQRGPALQQPSVQLVTADADHGAGLGRQLEERVALEGHVGRGDTQAGHVRKACQARTGQLPSSDRDGHGHALTSYGLRPCALPIMDRPPQRRSHRIATGP